MGDGLIEREELPAVAEAVGRNVKHTHHQSPFAIRQRAARESPLANRHQGRHQGKSKKEKGKSKDRWELSLQIAAYPLAARWRGEDLGDDVRRLVIVAAGDRVAD